MPGRETSQLQISPAEKARLVEKLESLELGKPGTAQKLETAFGTVEELSQERLTILQEQILKALNNLKRYQQDYDVYHQLKDDTEIPNKIAEEEKALLTLFQRTHPQPLEQIMRFKVPKPEKVMV